jgi:hypothetical protein
MQRCDVCGADREAGRPCDSGCSAAKRRSREPGAATGDYVPEVGDIVQVEGSGYGMVALVKGARLDVMMRYDHAVNGFVLIPCRQALKALTLVIPHEAPRRA